MGHWYAEDYVLAGVLTGVRVAGIAVGVPGIIKNNTALIVAGAVIAGASYIIDVADAPFAVDRYNERLEKKKKAENLFEEEMTHQRLWAASFSF